MPPRHTTRMEMPNPLDVVPDGMNYITFHDLHVIDVIEQLHPWRIYALHHCNAESRPITLVARVIDTAVEELHAHVDTGLLRKPRDFGQTFDAVIRSEEHTSELQSHVNLVCRLLLEKKKKK